MLPPIIELKAYVPSKNFTLTKAFYVDLGFQLVWEDHDLAGFAVGHQRFMLSNAGSHEPASEIAMHLLVPSTDAWWEHVQQSGVITKYNVPSEPPQDRSWGLRDFVLFDPSGVLWRIGSRIQTAK